MYTLFSKSLASLESPLEPQVNVHLSSRACHNDLVLQLEGDCAMTVSALSASTMAQWFILNGALTSVVARADPTDYNCNGVTRRSRYLSMPCYYAGMDVAVAGHMNALLFDHRTGAVYLIDPNGTSSFFQADLDKAHILVSDDSEEDDDDDDDDEFEQLPDAHSHHTSASQKLVEGILRDYCKYLSQNGGGQWTYVPQEDWNPYGLCVNQNIAASQVGNGYCVVTTLMLLHVLELTQQTPDLVVRKFASLSPDQLLSLIVSYNAGLARTLGV
jgi:hypothetical protein